MAASAPNNSPAGAEWESFKGIIKQVLSGDSVIVRGTPRGGPPPEKQINFSNVTAPRLGRRGTKDSDNSSDEPFAWESREFLRKKVIGKDVIFTIDPKSKTLNRDYGCIYLGKDVLTGENVVETMVREGWLTVRPEVTRSDKESKLIQAEEEAKALKKGIHSGSDLALKRQVKWTIENPRAFVDKRAGKLMDAIIEHVRDGSTVRGFILPDFYYFTLMISGIRAPPVRQDGQRPEPGSQEALGEQARYYVESRLLQQEVKLRLETVNNNNLVGSVVHPNGNIAEALLKEGFAKCVDWSMTTVSDGPEKLRSAEKFAKQKRLRVWADYKPTPSGVSDEDRSFVGKVIEVVNGDALVIQKSGGATKKIFLASIRPPRLDEKEQRSQTTVGKVFRPLYDIPLLFEAREFLRKKLIGQKVNVTVDYVQPAQPNYPEKTCCTVKIGDQNVAENLVSRGLATVIRYRQDDDQRAACYDDLLAAEAKAIKGGKGLHEKKKDIPIHRINEVSDANMAKKYLSFLKRGKVDAVPEFVASGSRMRLYLPSQNCLMTFLLAGISCPRASRMAPGGQGGMLEGEEFGNEALQFTKALVHQREVKIEVENMDKGGNFIGWLFYDNGSNNLSVELVRSGLSSVHVTAESSPHYHALVSAQNSARQSKLYLWRNYKPEEHVEKPVEEEISQERKVDYKPMVVSDITSEGKIFGQRVSDGPALEKLSEGLNRALTSHPPTAGAYNPRRGDLCAAKYGDGSWYRAKVEKVAGGKVYVYYVDYGNREVTHVTKCAQLPPGFTQQEYFAKEMVLALVKFYTKEEEYMEAALEALRLETEQQVLVNVEYKSGGSSYVSMQNKDKADIAKKLLSQGVVLLDSSRRDKRLQDLIKDYAASQEEARKAHRAIWQYGDVTEDDAHEFGMER